MPEQGGGLADVRSRRAGEPPGPLHDIPTLEIAGEQLARVDRVRWIPVGPSQPPWLSVSDDARDLFVRLHGQADFGVAEGGGLVRAHSAMGLAPATVRQLFLDHVVPLLWSRRGFVVLHAGAVSAPGGVAAFVGDSGQGKSTLVASFGREGRPIVTDDCLRLVPSAGRWWASPGPPQVRLWPASCAALVPSPNVRGNGGDGESGAKRTLVAGAAGWAFSQEAAPLRAVYRLEPHRATDPRIGIRRLSRREAVVTLVSGSFRAAFAAAWAAAELERLARVAEAVPVSVLSYPHHFDHLTRVHAAVEQDLAS